MESNAESSKLRSLIAHAWIALPLLVIGELLLDVVDMASEGNFSGLTAAANDGLFGVISVVIAGGILQSMLVRHFDHGGFRWIVFGITLVFVGYVFLHQGDHVVEIFREGISTHIPFDIAIDVIGVWTLILSWTWAGLKVAKNAASLKVTGAKS